MKLNKSSSNFDLLCYKSSALNSENRFKDTVKKGSWSYFLYVFYEPKVKFSYIYSVINVTWFSSVTYLVFRIKIYNIYIFHI